MAAIVIQDGLVLVGRRNFGGALGGLWEFPGGKVEDGEGEAAALERELLEEFGVGAHAVRPLAETSFLHKGKDRRLAGWLAELPAGVPLELREHLALRWVGREELEALDFAPSDRLLFPAVFDALKGEGRPAQGRNQ